MNEKYDRFTSRPIGLWNEYIIVNILRIFCNLRSCGYGHVVIRDNSDIARDATLQRKILQVQRGISSETSSLRNSRTGLLCTFLK